MMGGCKSTARGGGGGGGGAGGGLWGGVLFFWGGGGGGVLSVDGSEEDGNWGILHSTRWLCRSMPGFHCSSKM